MDKDLYNIRQNLVFEHRDCDATAMSIDYTGQWVLLAGRQHLTLQNLFHFKDVRKYERNSKYEVSAAEFAICPNRQEFCAIAATQNIEVLTWGASEPRLFSSLRGHTRLVTDIDWHSKNSNLLVSCSIDTFSHIWDLRDPRKPTLSLTAVCMSGATQVGFNRASGNLLAAAHDGDLRIWDIRKGSSPVRYITAHLNRVHGINWSHQRETCLATASQDGTVKYFDINIPRRAEKIITTSSPVWRARYTPIGTGLVTIGVPYSGRGENSLLLWSNSKQTDPICSFVGHSDVILDFGWRTDRKNFLETELVTWSRDRTIRIYKIDEKLLKHCEPECKKSLNSNMSKLHTTLKKNAPKLSSDIKVTVTKDYASLHPAISLPSGNANDELLAQSPLTFLQFQLRTARSLSDQPTCSLHHEFSLLNTNIPYVDVICLDAIKRFAVFKISAGGKIVKLQVSFPTEYPSRNVGPNFSFCEGTNIPNHLTTILLKVLKSNALQRVKKSRTCLEQCLRALVIAMKKIVCGLEKSKTGLQSPHLEGALCGALQDACIPFPRTSSVSFNAIGMLTSFSQMSYSKLFTLRHQHTTPRALSAISGSLLGNIIGPQSNASFFIQERLTPKSSKLGGISKPISFSPVVYIYDTSKILSLNKNFAHDVSVDKYDIIMTCQKNRKLSENYDRFDLVDIWTLVEVVYSEHYAEKLSIITFFEDPFKKLLLEALVIHFAKCGDLQFAVILSCLFYECPKTTKITLFNSLQNKYVKFNSPYHTVLPIDNLSTSNQALTITAGMSARFHRSNSWSDRLYWIESKSSFTDSYIRASLKNIKRTFFINFNNLYAELLFYWNLRLKRVLVLKYTKDAIIHNNLLEFVLELFSCKEKHNCSKLCLCHRIDIFCCLCCVPVKGAMTACPVCGHGGHAIHMQTWFEGHTICPTGCGCLCLQECDDLLKSIN